MTFRKGLTLWLTFLILLFPASLVADTAGDPSTETTNDPTGDDTGYDANGAGDSADGSDVEEPTYSNAAQAMHAANLAETASAQPNEATKEAAESLDSAREAYDTSRKESLADPENPELAEAMQVAEKELEQARETYGDRVGELAGVMGEEIQAMRQNKMGWGQIAHELGVHPGTLGLGHTKRKGALDPVDPVDAVMDESAEPADPDAEIAEATRRDPKTGWNSGHGMAAAKSGNSKKGLGLPETSAAVSSTTPGKALGKDKSSQSKSSGAQSSQNTASTSSSSSTQSNSGRAADGGPSNSNKGGNSGNEKNDKSGKSNNGNGNKKN
jgi:hypothetical protein